MKKLLLLFTIHSALILAAYAQPKPKTVMLVLGSHQTDIITRRIQVALKLYKTETIDKIIVSGGCGAHSSSICEATEMAGQLVKNGVPERIIYKEENAKTTVQNYIFSRALRDESGEQIIKKNDNLFVVSDHWHAISVAARFKKYDQVNARFFIEGDIEPKATDVLDYSGIFNKIADNTEFILRNTWPTPTAVYQSKQNRNFLFLDRIYSVGNKDTVLTGLDKWMPQLPQAWMNRVDAVAGDRKRQQTLVFSGAECLIISDKKNTAPPAVSLQQLIRELPDNIKFVDAAFVGADDLYLFVKDKLYIAKRTGKGFTVTNTQNIKSWITGWPYAWGSGDLAAADYDEDSQTVFLYKNREVLKFSLKQRTAVSPEKLTIKWQDVKR